MAFVMVLSYSRRIYLRFFLNARMENFLRGHIGAFDAFGGCSRVVLYDNLKSAVLERQDQAIRIHPTLTALACVFRAKLDTHSTANWTPGPAQTGHSFHGKLDTGSAPNWTV